jgi:hypothetical protein
MITEQKQVIGCGVSTIMKGSRESVAGRASGLPAPVSVRHGKPKDRRRPRLTADGSGNQCLRRASFGGIIVHSVPFRGSRPRGIAVPGGVGEPLTQSLVGMPGPRRNCAAGLPVRAWHVAACIPEAAKAHVRCQLTRRSTWTSVRGDGPYGTLPEAPLTLAVTGSFDLPRLRGTGFALK